LPGVGLFLVTTILAEMLQSDDFVQIPYQKVEQPPDITPPSPPCVPASKLKFLMCAKGGAMIERNVTLPEMILWTGTRVALGAGIGMLISRRLSKDAMKAAGLALVVVGAFTTIPLAISIIGNKNLTRPEIRSVA
jgi:hypothetical protein